jgi:hypothetical protein
MKISPAPFNYTYSFNCSDGRFDNVTSILSNLEVIEVSFYVPQLENPQVNPLVGNGTTIFNFTVTYYDADNNLPITMNITVGGSTYNMTQVKPADTNATNGIDFYFNTSLPYGFYQFQINCSDLGFYNGTALIGGPEVNPFYGYSTNVNLLTPIDNGANYTGILNFTWTSLEAPFGAVNYTWQLSNQTYFAFIFLEELNILENSTISNTSQLINFPTGTYYWRVRATYNQFNHTWSGYYTLNITLNNLAPNLTSGTVDPLSGNQGTDFNFTVIYIDLDNNNPLYVNVIINGTSNLMTKLNPLDNDYTDGCIYNYTAQLDDNPFNYTYYFNCSDGKYTNATIVYNNLEVVHVSLFAPVLVNPQVTPTIGGNTTLFNFTVEYWDADDDPAIIVNITVNGTTIIMTEADGSDTNVTDGKLYYYNTTFDHGFYQFQINCSDGTWFSNTSWIIGPEVNPFISIGVPDITTPAISVSTCTNGISLTWNSLNCSLGPVNYTIQISKSSSFSSIFYELLGINETNDTTGICITVSMDGLELAVSFTPGVYYWRIRPTFEAYVGNWSSTLSFTISEVSGPAEPPDIFIIILIIIIGAVVGALFVFIKMRSSGDKVKKPKTVEEKEEPVKVAEKKSTKPVDAAEKPIVVKKGKKEMRYFTKIGITCSNCRTPYLLLINTLDKFKCIKCQNQGFNIVYRCDKCKSIQPVSRVVYTSTGKQESFDCPNCDGQAVLVKDIIQSEVDIDNIEFQTELKSPQARDPTKITEDRAPKDKIVEIIEKRHLAEVPEVSPLHDIQIGAVCTSCRKKSMIRNIERDQYRCDNCLNTSFYVAYQCKNCNKINAITKDAFIKGNEPAHLECPECKQQMDLVKQ